jgi:hypothetical protein
MAILRRTRVAQYPLVAEFVFNYTDGMTPLTALNGPSVELNRFPGVTDFGSGLQPMGMLTSTVWTQNPGANTSFFEAVQLPNGAQVIGGDVQIEAPYVCNGTATLSIGDANVGTLYASGINLKGTAFGGAVTGATNAGTNPQVVSFLNATSNNITAVGQTVVVAGVVPAAYNGTFVVDSFSATAFTVTNPQLNAALTFVSAGTGTALPTGRTALTIPDEITNIVSLNANFGPVQFGEDAASGTDVRLSLTFGSALPAATQGRVRVRIMYTIDGRMSEVATQ